MTNELTLRKPLRLWPGVVAAVLLVLLRFGAPLVSADGSLVAVLGSVVAGLLIVVWWLFFSRAPWSERLGVLVLMIVAAFATRYLVHPSISGGMMGMMLPIYLAIPGLSVALVAAVVITRGSAAATRRVAIVAAILLACGAFTLLRTDGIMGGTPQIAWRWTPTAEERLLAEAREAPSAPVAAPASASSIASAALPSPTPATTGDPSLDPARGDAAAPPPVPEATANPEDRPAMKAGEALAMPLIPASVRMPVRWPGFRGPARDGIIPGVRIDTDWAKSAPVRLWRQPIGPGWSSFAVAGDLLYTQEQRGDDEVVAAYSVTNGKPVWMHKDKVRFYESNGGAGPRATPTLSNGRVYALGATGILNALDAANGAVAWSRNAVTDAGITVPDWGISASPVVIGDVVVVAVSGALAGYDRGSGAPRWSVKPRGGGESYSSPHLVAVDGIQQILLMSAAGATSVAPADGKVLWEYAWAGTPMVQPAQIAGGDFLITTADAMGALGMRRIAVTHSASGWTAVERWTSSGLKPYFNDFVIHEGHAYGFDGAILSCISLEDGSRKWKGGRYGNGQFVLLPDQDLMLVLSEDGELALVSATPDKFTEIARVPALEGKTWNHPVLIGDVLLVRNGEEMVAFRLKLAAGTR